MNSTAAYTHVYYKYARVHENETFVCEQKKNFSNRTKVKSWAQGKRTRDSFV